MLGQRPKVAGEPRRLEARRDGIGRPPLKLGVRAPAEEDLGERNKLIPCDSEVAPGRGAQAALVQVLVPQLLACKDQDLVVSGGHEVRVPLAQRGAEAHDWMAGAAARDATVTQRLRHLRAAAVAHGADLRDGA